MDKPIREHKEKLQATLKKWVERANKEKSPYARGVVDGLEMGIMDCDRTLRDWGEPVKNTGGEPIIESGCPCGVLNCPGPH